MPRAKPQTRLRTSEDVYELVERHVLPELAFLRDSMEKASLLNGHGELLAKFLDEYERSQSKKTAYSVVWKDVASKLTWLRSPQAILRALLLSIIGGLGWIIASHILTIKLPFFNP